MGSEQTTAGKTPTAQRKIASDYGRLPISFEANTGQSDSRVKFLAHGRDYGLFLTGQEAVFAFHAAAVRHDSIVQKSSRDSVVRMQLRGSNAGALAEGVQPLPGTANYLIGKDPSQWHTNIPTWSKVRFSSVYPGIDLLYYGNQSQLEYDFVVAPEANANSIKLRFSGASRIKLTAAGDLSVSSRDGQIVFQKPVIYQEDHGKRRAVKGGFALHADRTVGFNLGRYDQSTPLIIDPVLQYSTYLGGSDGSSLSAIAVDDAGNTYVAGSTLSHNFPVTPGAFQEGGIPTTGVVSKLNASGTALIYSTYLGGSTSNVGYISTMPNGIAVDAAGNAYVSGLTNTTNFPVTAGAFQAQLKSQLRGNVFVTKLNPSGSGLVYSTYVGGSNTDTAAAIALDDAGDAYVAGTTFSSDFPVTSGAFQTVKNAESSNTGFITKLNPDGSGLVYSTYLGGSGGDAANAIALDQAGNAYVAGSAYSPDFPVTEGAFQTKNNAVANYASNAFITKLNATGAALVYSTYLGGSGIHNINGYNDYGDYATAIAVDPFGNGYVTGSTYSLDFPVRAWAFQTKNNGAAHSVPNAFVTKLNSEGTALLYSTYLGGTVGPYDEAPVGTGDHGLAIVIDTAGHAYVTGYATSTNFPLTSGAYQRLLTDSANAFIAEVNPKGSALEYSSYLGGDGFDIASAIARDKSGYIYLAGSTSSGNFPITPGAYQQTSHGPLYETGFVTKLALEPSNTLATTTSLTSNPLIYGQPVILTATVSGGASGIVPTGTVTFFSGVGPAETVDLNDAGEATYTNTAPGLYPGVYDFYAIYNGDAQFAESLSPTLAKQVIPTQPAFSLAPGKYTGSATVQISDSMPGAVIHYTLDGSEATASSPVYTSALTFTAGYRVLRAVAIFSGVPSVNTYGSYTVVAQTPTH